MLVKKAVISTNITEKHQPYLPLFFRHLEPSLYSKTCVKRPLKNTQNKDLNDMISSKHLSLGFKKMILKKISR